MIEVCYLADAVAADVEFDEYVPVTITWPGAYRLLDPPLYVRYSGLGRLLQLKFHPESRRLIELVLVSASGLRRVHESLNLPAVGATAMARWSDSAGEVAGEGGPPALTAFDDCLVLGISAVPPERWVGTEPVVFGLDRADQVTAISVGWGASGRDLVVEAAHAL